MIKFHEISYRNFLSTGNTPNVILLDRTPSALITGTNGAGKSTILDAICFAVFGKPYRNINKPQLVNTVNEKHCEVEVKFSVKGVPYRVVRGIKPNKFEIYRNEKEVKADAALRDQQQYLEDVLGLNYRAFTQIVILGSARYQSFMDIPTHERRSIIEELLDITVFSKMNQVLKARQQNLDLDIKENDYNKKIAETKISGQKGIIENILKHQKESKDKIEKEVVRVEAEREVLQKQIDEITSIIDDRQSQIDTQSFTDIKEVDAKINEATVKGKEVLSKKKQKEERITFYETAEDCHACGQEISEDFKIAKIAELTEEKDKFESILPQVKVSIDKLNESKQLLQTQLEEINGLWHGRKALENEVSTLVSYLATLQESSKQEDKEQSLSEANEALDTLEKNLLDLEKNGIELSEMSHYLEACKILLKDTGIKAKIIKQYLPVINKLVNQNLEKMGAEYSFHLDESFNEIIKSRYRDAFSYASFSEGEKTRIDLSLMFTWREIAKIKNSVNTNLLIMDEVGDGSLDGEAVDSLWDIISDLEDTNVFVISHNQKNADKFRTNIVFHKDGNFSKIVDSKR